MGSFVAGGAGCCDHGGKVIYILAAIGVIAAIYVSVCIAYCIYVDWFGKDEPTTTA